MLSQVTVGYEKDIQVHEDRVSCSHVRRAVSLRVHRCTRDGDVPALQGLELGTYEAASLPSCCGHDAMNQRRDPVSPDELHKAGREFWKVAQQTG
jgi:hypothetical protein